MQQSDVVRRENLWLLDCTYQNSRERWNLLTQDTRLWLQQRGDTLFDSLAPDAQTPSQSLSPDPTGAPR